MAQGVHYSRVMKPNKIGNYIRINGFVYCVTGRRQAEAARAPYAGRAVMPVTPITHWDGASWSDTGLVFNWNRGCSGPDMSTNVEGDLSVIR